ncbi:MAG: coniferyl-aldehyde dehydrogenase [Halomonadaceae bacterium T82-2]|nr:MAG: coniferyl-aldehyde dehydrogenase [Halomonadaceae bacterium T82-2]
MERSADHALKTLFAAQRQAYDAHPYPALSVRLGRLARLAQLTRRHAGEIEAAIARDFGHRSRVETRLAELTTLQQAIRHARRHLRRWMRPRRVRVGWRFWPARAEIHSQPLGVVGIMAPWNYPWNLALLPAVDALAAGNRVMIKPSEHAPATAELLQSLVARYFDPAELGVVTGDADASRAFAALPFDHLLFTGSSETGRQVAQAAAANLTPVTLELGGKSPAILDETTDLDDAARRIAFGKWFNAGQTCIAPDYVLLPQRRLNAFAEALERAVRQLYPDPAGNPDYSALLGSAARERLIALRREAEQRGCRVIEIGGDDATFAAGGKLAPTLILDPQQSLRVMREEIFGPLLPLVGVQDMDAAVNFVNARPRPLALYAFTDNPAHRRLLLTRTHSGGLVINDTLWHIAQPALPFGGIGTSGHGAYHGEHGFLTFSHQRSVFRQSRHSSVTRLHPPYRRWLLRLMGLF